jgi:hypothetical protein
VGGQQFDEVGWQVVALRCGGRCAKQQRANPQR